MGPTYKIAELVKISPVAATAYCEKVRLLSGLGSALLYKTIAQHVAQHLNEDSSPETVAEIIRKNGLEVPPVRKAKSTKIKQTSLAKPRRWNISRAEMKARQSRSRLERRKDPTPPPAYIVRGSYFDHTRVAEQKLEHCPHGVPQGRVCAICDPKKFREITGID